MRTGMLCVMGVVAAALAAYAADSEALESAPPAGPVPALVQRFLASEGPPIVSYRAFRTLEAETRGGQMRARLTAWTSLDPIQGFQYTVEDEEGSNLICRKVLRAALEAERSMRAAGEIGRGALIPANYQFTDAPGAAEAPAGLARIAIHPNRQDTLLVDGGILLTVPDGDLVEVDGVLVKRPSFWTRRVEVVRRYARVGGVRVPVAMRSTATVLLVGASTFSMAYEYESINGEPVSNIDLRPDQLSINLVSRRR